MSSSIFVTGTGTNVGKTYASALIIRKLRKRGLSAGYYKPIVSGVNKNYLGKLSSGDPCFVCNMADINESSPDSMVSYAYNMAVSPHLSSQQKGNPPTYEKIQADFKTISKKYDYLTVEGCGGIVCPLRHDDLTIMLTDIIKRLDLSILIVTPSDLGAINGSVLTAEYANLHDINIKGFIMNFYDGTNIIHRDNQSQIENITIENITGLPVLGKISLNGNLVMTDDDLLHLYRK